MFTLKFFRQDGSQESLAAQRYTVMQNTNSTISVWVYPTLRAENPVLLDLGLTEDQTTFYELFVENQAGKTIDRFRAPN